MPSPSPLPGPDPRRATRARPLPAPSSGPPGLEAALDPAERHLYRALRRDWHARIRPRDEAERAAADTAVGRIWRRWRLEAVEEQVLRALGRGAAVPGLPSLAQLVRYRARLAADYAQLADELAELRDSRPALPERPDLTPERLEWLAARLRERGADPGRADRRGERRAEPAGEPAHAAPETTSAASSPNPSPQDPPPADPSPAESGPADRADPTAARHAAPEPPRPPGWALRHPPPGPVPRRDWLASTSRYALEAALLAHGRGTAALKDPRTTPS